MLLDWLANSARSGAAGSLPCAGNSDAPQSSGGRTVRTLLGYICGVATLPVIAWATYKTYRIRKGLW